MPNHFQATWTIKNVIYVLLAVVGAFVLINSIFQFTGLNVAIKAAVPQNLLIIFVFIIQSLILLLPIVVLSFIKQKKWKWSDFGFTKKNVFKSIIPAIGGYLIYLGITLMITLVVLYGGIKIPGYQISQPVLPLFGTSNLSLMIAGIIIIFIAPFIEEIFFRGFVLQGLVNGTNKYFGAIATAIIFAVIHLQFGSFLPIFILGLILSVLFIRSKSIWPCLWFHVINNVVAFVIELLILKGVIPLDL